jgi:hypothetical protein
MDWGIFFAQPEWGSSQRRPLDCEYSRTNGEGKDFSVHDPRSSRTFLDLWGREIGQAQLEAEREHEPQPSTTYAPVSSDDYRRSGVPRAIRAQGLVHVPIRKSPTLPASQNPNCHL